jgi:Flp pilus assembly protein TadG
MHCALSLPACALAGFFRDRQGAVAIIFALALIPLLLGAGAAIDLGRAYMVKSRLGYAIDAAALAVGAATTTDRAELEEIMLAFFAANYPANELGVPATPVMEINDSEVTIYATAEVSTTLMSIADVTTLTVSAETLVIRETKGLEVALVLDNTGSMGTTKMNNLKDAAQIFLDILYGREEENDLLKVAVVPFAGTVNVGTDFGFLKSTFDNDDWSPDDWRGCVMARGGERDRNDAAPINNTTKWDGYLKPSDRNNNWPPVRSYKGPNLDCPVQLLPLTTTKSTVEDKITEMSSAGITHINVGLVWGWRVLSPGEPFTGGVAYDDEDYNKAIVLMTDGENTFSSSSFGAYGYLSDGNLGTTRSNTAESRLDSRTTEVCDAIKAEGILIYTITFQVSSNSARNLMRDCATDTSKYFDSPNAATLTQTFRAIGKELSNLRIGG